MRRDEISEAPYNPRKINERQFKALKASLEKYGLLTPLILNERTGSLVGGHQRLKALDSLHRKKDYEMDVAVVDMSVEEEVAANVALNNQSLMGEFDFEGVQALADTYELDLENDFLFDRDDLLVSFGVDLDDVQVQKRDASADEALMQSIKDRKKEVREKFKDARDQEGDYTSEVKGTLTVVFDKVSDLEAFLQKKGLPLEQRVVHAVTLGL